jgi:hypothetical protein
VHGNWQARLACHLPIIMIHHVHVHPIRDLEWTYAVVVYVWDDGKDGQSLVEWFIKFKLRMATSASALEKERRQWLSDIRIGKLLIGPSVADSLCNTLGAPDSHVFKSHNSLVELTPMVEDGLAVVNNTSVAIDDPDEMFDDPEKRQRVAEEWQAPQDQVLLRHQPRDLAKAQRDQVQANLLARYPPIPNLSVRPPLLAPVIQDAKPLSDVFMPVTPPEAPNQTSCIVVAKPWAKFSSR